MRIHSILYNSLGQSKWSKWSGWSGFSGRWSRWSVIGGLLVLVWSVLVHSVLVCSGLGLRDILYYLVSEYLGFHDGSFDDSHCICAYTHWTNVRSHACPRTHGKWKVLQCSAWTISAKLSRHSIKIWNWAKWMSLISIITQRINPLVLRWWTRKHNINPDDRSANIQYQHINTNIMDMSKVAHPYCNNWSFIF